MDPPEPDEPDEPDEPCEPGEPGEPTDQLERYCRVTLLGPAGEPVGAGHLEGRGPPDMATVGAVAQLALAAVRAGGRLVVDDVAPDLGELLRLAGLHGATTSLVVRFTAGGDPGHPPSSRG